MNKTILIENAKKQIELFKNTETQLLFKLEEMLTPTDTPISTFTFINIIAIRYKNNINDWGIWEKPNEQQGNLLLVLSLYTDEDIINENKLNSYLNNYSKPLQKYNILNITDYLYNDTDINKNFNISEKQPYTNNCIVYINNISHYIKSLKFIEAEVKKFNNLIASHKETHINDVNKNHFLIKKYTSDYDNHILHSVKENTSFIILDGFNIPNYESKSEEIDKPIIINTINSLNKLKEKFIPFDSKKDISYEKIEEIEEIEKIEIEKVFQHIVDQGKKQQRHIEYNEIVNILVCMSQGFLTVFAGEPGTGKTSIVNLLAEVLNLKENNRYVEVPVEKGWTSKKDLLGYYNPFSKEIVSGNVEMLTALKTLNEEDNNPNNLPFIILLDEANLSQMEYYWADFMPLCDMDKSSRVILLDNENSELSNNKLNIPNSLKFIATINLDNTTEALSPRLIDRSFIIMSKSFTVDELCEFLHNANNNLDNDLNNDDTYNKVHLLMSHIDELNEFEPIKQEDFAFVKLKEILTLFKDNDISVSPRVVIAISKYYSVAKKYFISEDNSLTSEEIALDFAISQKLLPKINGYGDGYIDFIEKFKKSCRKDNKETIILPKTFSILEKINENGNKLGYYNFFTRGV